MVLRLIALIDRINLRVGHAAAWLAIAMAFVQFMVVLLRYVFSVGFVWMQETVIYCYGALFMLGAGYALLQDAHVRLDVFYRDASQTTKAWVDLIGSIILLLPVCGLVLWLSWDYVLRAWTVGERSGEAMGLPLAFAYKTVIWVFAVLLAAQGVSLALKCWAYLSGRIDAYPVSTGLRVAGAEGPGAIER